MNKVWLKQYPEGIPAEIDVDRYTSLKSILEQSCTRFADLPAYGNMGMSIAAVKIVVVKKDPSLTAQQLIEHGKKHLTGYKVPNIVEFRTEPLPKSNIGKILRRELRDGRGAVPSRSRPKAR